MGLPSKKQLHKHKRGARKALNTLDVMEQNEKKDMSDSELNKLELDLGSQSKAEISERKESLENKADSAINSATDPVSDNPTSGNLTDLERSDLLQTGEIKSLELEESQRQTIEEPQASKPDKKRIDLGLMEEVTPDVIVNTNLKSNNKSAESSPKLSSETKPADSTEGFLVADSKPVEREKAKDTLVSDEYDEDFEDTQKDKYLSFRIGEESFGFSIKYVTEIIVIHKITEVPDTPTFVRGVINLRGKVIPVIDVRHRFGMELREYDDRTCIIVVEYNETAVGLIVDTVNEVVDIPEDKIDPPPRTHSGIKSGYIQGMGKIGKQVNILLDLEKVLFVEELLAKHRDLQEY